MKPKLLIVDDDTLILEMLSACLCLDYEVTTCAHCDEAIHLMRSGEVFFGAVLSDYDCPTPAGGAKVALVMRELMPGIPFIIMSGNPDGYKITNECKPDRYLPKPLEIAEVVDVLEQCVGRRSKTLAV